MSQPRVGILMGSPSDAKVMRAGAEILEDFGVPFEMKVLSAHRIPDKTAEYARSAEKRGIKVLIGGAGMAAHLAGTLAAHSILPVIGVPVGGGSLGGIDALLATVQMPGGIPVATVSIGKAGAKNAGLLAVQILSQSDPTLIEKLHEYRRKMREKIESINLE